MSNQTRVTLSTQDDQIAEANGTITLLLIPHSNYKVSTQNSATIKVSDAEDRQLREQEIATRTHEILPEYLNLIGGRTLATTSQRIQDVQGDTNSFSSYRINGASGLTQLITTSGEIINSDSETLRSILGNSAFELDIYSEDTLAHPISIWGLGELNNVSSSNGDSSSDWDGDAFTGHLGFDTQLNHNVLLGMSSSTVDLDAGYAQGQSNEFLFRSRSTTFNPYLSWTSPSNDAQLQTIVGYGFGEIDIKQPGYQYETLQSNSSNISFSGRKQLYSAESFLTGGTSELNLIGESWIASLQVEEKAGILNETNLSAQHHRVAVDGSHKIDFARGASITPTLSLGLLHDGKDQNTLRGVEFNNGVSYSDPIGLELAGNARMIFEQTSQARLWNLNGSIYYDFGNDQLGTMFKISGTYAQTPSNYSELLNMSIIDNGSSGSMENSVNTELQYGLSICGTTCLVTPYAGYDFDTNGLSQSQLGVRLSIGTFMNLEVERTNNPISEVSTNQKVQFSSRFDW